MTHGSRCQHCGRLPCVSGGLPLQCSLHLLLGGKPPFGMPLCAFVWICVCVCWPCVRSKVGVGCIVGVVIQSISAHVALTDAYDFLRPPKAEGMWERVHLPTSYPSLWTAFLLLTCQLVSTPAAAACCPSAADQFMGRARLAAPWGSAVLSSTRPLATSVWCCQCMAVPLE